MVVTMRVAQWATMPDGAPPGVRDSGEGMPGGTERVRDRLLHAFARGVRDGQLRPHLDLETSV
jgi:hypothetical protein